MVALALIGFVSDRLEELAAALIHAWRWLIHDANGRFIVDPALTIGEAVPVPAPWSWP